MNMNMNMNIYNNNISNKNSNDDDDNKKNENDSNNSKRMISYFTFQTGNCTIVTSTQITSNVDQKKKSRASWNKTRWRKNQNE